MIGVLKRVQQEDRGGQDQTILSTSEEEIALKKEHTGDHANKLFFCCWIEKTMKRRREGEKLEKNKALQLLPLLHQTLTRELQKGELKLNQYCYY